MDNATNPLKYPPKRRNAAGSAGKGGRRGSKIEDPDGDGSRSPEGSRFKGHEPVFLVQDLMISATATCYFARALGDAGQEARSWRR